MRYPVTTLGEPRYPSPLNRFVGDDQYVTEHIVRGLPERPEELLFELAGPRAKLFFQPKHTRAGIVTCGGLCPGLNNIIRSLFNELRHAYGVNEVLGFRGGYRGLDPARGEEPILLTPEFVEFAQRIAAQHGQQKEWFRFGLNLMNLATNGGPSPLRT